MRERKNRKFPTGLSNSDDDGCVLSDSKEGFYGLAQWIRSGDDVHPTADGLLLR